MPRLRFKDDAGNEFPEWEEIELGQVATFLKGKNVAKNDICDSGKYECIRYGELYTEYNEVIKTIKSKTNLQEKDLVFSKFNDVIIPSSGETQIDIATASCVLKDGVALGGDLNIIRSELNGVFLSYYLNHVKRLEIAKLAQGNAVVHLYSNQLKALKIEVPIKAEQDKIANFLSLIEEKISKLEDELEALHAYKKGVMQALFAATEKDQFTPPIH